MRGSSRLTLLAQGDDPDAAGTFSGARASEAGGLVPYAGRFAAIPDNPAIGAALSFDIGADGQWDQLYFVLGVRRWFGRVTALCLAGRERPFLLTRLY